MRRNYLHSTPLPTHLQEPSPFRFDVCHRGYTWLASYQEKITIINHRLCTLDYEGILCLYPPISPEPSGQFIHSFLGLNKYDRLVFPLSHDVLEKFQKLVVFLVVLTNVNDLSDFVVGTEV